MRLRLPESFENDGQGTVFGYVAPNEIAGMSGNTTSTRIIFRSGASMDVPMGRSV
jgi:hypothetical protein